MATTDHVGPEPQEPSSTGAQPLVRVGGNLRIGVPPDWIAEESIQLTSPDARLAVQATLSQVPEDFTLDEVIGQLPQTEDASDVVEVSSRSDVSLDGQPVHLRHTRWEASGEEGSDLIQLVAVDSGHLVVISAAYETTFDQDLRAATEDLLRSFAFGPATGPYVHRTDDLEDGLLLALDDPQPGTVLLEDDSGPGDVDWSLARQSWLRLLRET